MCIYKDQGYTNRREYLASLADDYGLPVGIVFELASMLGQIEDFDGLVTACDDYAQFNYI